MNKITKILHDFRRYLKENPKGTLMVIWDLIGTALGIPSRIALIAIAFAMYKDMNIYIYCFLISVLIIIIIFFIVYSVTRIQPDRIDLTYKRSKIFTKLLKDVEYIKTEISKEKRR